MKKLFRISIVLVFFMLSGCSSKNDLTINASAAPAADEIIPAYYYAKYLPTDTVKTILTKAGFEVVATYASTKNSETIIVTDETLKDASAKPGQGFAAIERILVDHEHQRIAMLNPVYFGKAFLQSDFDYDKAVSITHKLQNALGTLTPSEDAYEYGGLGTYQFMVGMPEYKDVYVLGEGENQTLLSKLQTFKDGQHVVFVLDLGEGRSLVGFDLSRRTKKFVEKIGTQNAELLPYTILIEDSKATALAAKYYLALSYPLLTMGEFMMIATIPGAIERELEQPFR